MADDDADDRMLAARALRDTECARDLRFVADGEELMDYLHRRGAFSDPATAPRPDLVLLDLNMPRKDGREALAEIKADPRFRCIPVLVLTTSSAEEDVLRTYELGGNSYITKPTSFRQLVETMQAIRRYWLDIARLPPGPGHHASPHPV